MKVQPASAAKEARGYTSGYLSARERPNTLSAYSDTGRCEAQSGPDVTARPAMPSCVNRRKVMMNRVRNSGIAHPTPYFSELEGLKKKAELDRYLDRKMDEWK